MNKSLEKRIEKETDSFLLSRGFRAEELHPRHSDGLDFHELSISQIRDFYREAFLAGMNYGLEECEKTG